MKLISRVCAVVYTDDSCVDDIGVFLIPSIKPSCYQGGRNQTINVVGLREDCRLLPRLVSIEDTKKNIFLLYSDVSAMPIV